MSDTVFKSSFLSGTADAAVSIALPKPAGDPLDDRTLSEQTYPHEPDTPLKITGEQTIRTAGELHKAFTEHLARGMAVAVDLSEVDVCDTAALQLIYAMHQSAVQCKQPFRITAVSTAITEAATAMGLSIEGLGTACGPATGDSHSWGEGINSGI